MACEFPVAVKAKLMLTAIRCLFYFFTRRPIERKINNIQTESASCHLFLIFARRITQEKHQWCVDEVDDGNYPQHPTISTGNDQGRQQRTTTELERH